MSVRFYVYKYSSYFDAEGRFYKGRRVCALLVFRLKGCPRLLQADVCEPTIAMTLKLYGTVAVMSSVTSHSSSLVGEHWLLGIQMWLRYRLSYSLAKEEKKAQSHCTPFEAD